MSNDIGFTKPAGATLPAAFQGKTVAKVFQNRTDLEKGSEGIEGSYGIMKFSGKVWSLQYRGENRKFMRPDGDGPRGSIDVIFVRMAGGKAKTFYKSFVEGSKEKPICWSNDGQRPDPAVPPTQKQHNVCGACPQNVFGSRITDDGKQAKACSDHKRTAIVLDPKLVMEVLGMPLSEPVLLRIPAASLNDFSTFSDTMNAQNFPVQSIVVKIGFDPTKNYPKFKFEAIRPLTDEEGDIVELFRNDIVSQRIISDNAMIVDGADEPGALQAGSSVGASSQGPNLGTQAGQLNGGQVGQQKVVTQPQAVTQPQGTSSNVVSMDIAPRAEALNPNPPQDLKGPTPVDTTVRETPEQQAQKMAEQATQATQQVVEPEPGAGPAANAFDQGIADRISQLLGS